MGGENTIYRNISIDIEEPKVAKESKRNISLSNIKSCVRNLSEP